MAARTKYVLTLILATALGLFVISAPWEHWPIIRGLPLLPEFLRRALPQVGEALITAAVLALLVDKAVKRELLERFAREVSHHIIGHRLPTALRDYVLRYLTVEIIRTDWDITYTIEPIGAHPGFIKLTTSVSSLLQNTSPREKKYDCAFSVERSWAPEIGESSIVSLALTAPTAGESFDLRHGKGLEQRPVDNFIQVSREITLPPMPHGEYRCLSESVEYFPDCFVAQFVALLPVLRTTFTVYYPKELMNVDLQLSCEDGSPRKIELANGTQWTIEAPLIHGQSISTRWGRAVSGAMGSAAREEATAASR
jgi:hypothetical protein